jgi:hypothetical protein
MSAAVRDRVIARLSDAFAQDELPVEEFERRLTAAYHAESPDALQALVGDLTAREAVVQSTALVPANRTEARSRTLAVLGSTTRRGHWTVPRHMRVVATLGSVVLDFRDASFAPGVSEVDARAILGSVEIIVPPDLAVETSGTGVLGSFEALDRAPAQADPERPLLRVHGVAVAGSVEVMTRLRGR